MTEIPDPSGLLRLPAELIQHVLTYLSLLDLVNTSSTCRTLYHHACDDQIWQPLVAINANLPTPLASPAPFGTFRELYAAQHPRWFLPRNRIWFSDSQPNGKLVLCRYEPRTASIEAYTVVATRGPHSLQFWEKDREVIIHAFNPRIALDLDRPVLKLGATDKDDDAKATPYNKKDAPSSKYAKETVMPLSSDPGLFASFMLCRALPPVAISETTQVWPPLRLPASARARNESTDSFSSKGYRPDALSQISENNFRVRKWVEYTGRSNRPSFLSVRSPNGLAAALGLSPPSYLGGGVSVRMPEDITTFASLPPDCYTPTPSKPWQGIWVGDYSGHGCEYLVIRQPDKQDERPLPDGMDWLYGWFRGRPVDSAFDPGNGSNMEANVQAEVSALQDWAEAARQQFGDDAVLGDVGESSSSSAAAAATQTEKKEIPDREVEPTGRLEGIKLTGDLNIPRGEYTFIAPDIGPRGLMRVADEQIFRGARVVRSAGHIAGRGFMQDQYTPSQLIMISHDRLAQYWEGFGHISFYQRVDIDALMEFGEPSEQANWAARHAEVAQAGNGVVTPSPDDWSDDGNLEEQGDSDDDDERIP